mgnify:CR=1 FL=1
MRGFGVAMRKLKSTVSVILALTMLLSVLSLGVFAASESPTVKSVTLNETRSVVTIKFDREIESAVSSYSGKFRISKKGSSLSSLSFSKVSVSGDSLIITLSSVISTPNNYISISGGTLKNQPDVINTPIFDGSEPALLDKDSVVLNSSEKTVTLKFKSSISGYPSDSSLKDGYITLARNGSNFNEVIPKDDIYVNGSSGEIVISLSEWLSGTRSRFRIATAKLKNTENGNINLSDITTGYIDASKTSEPLDVDYVETSTDRKTVSIYFTNKIKNAYYSGVSSSVANSLLKSHIWLSRGSANKYEPLSAADSLTVGPNYLRIVFDSSLSSSKNYIKVDAGSLTDYYDVPLDETIETGNITSGSSNVGTRPSYVSAYLSSSKKIVINFSTSVTRNPSLSSSELRDKISISRNGGSYSALSSRDSVTFSGSTMIITLSSALTGSKNRVHVSANAVSSSTGVLLSSSFTTSYLYADSYDDQIEYDNEYPVYSKVSYNSKTQTALIYFKNDIRTVSSKTLRNCISLSRNGGSYQTLTSSDAVTISPKNCITIVLAEPLKGSENSFKIANGSLADYDTGYVQRYAITTDYITASSGNSSETTSDFSSGANTSLSSDFYEITLDFGQPISNNCDSLERLKEKIELSRSGRFSSLGTDDYVRIDASTGKLLVILAKPATDFSSQVRILSGALLDKNGDVISKGIITEPLGEADGEPRTYINNSGVTNIVSSEISGNTVIGTVDSASGLGRLSSGADLLFTLPADASSATLNVSSAVVNEVAKYNGNIGVSCSGTAYFVSSSSLNNVASGDTLSLSISSASQSSVSALSNAEYSQSFKTEAGAKKFSASVVSSLGAKNSVTHTAFSKKRLMVSEPVANATSRTLVRIENSGTVVPVPSITETFGSMTYVTADTRVDGDYAVISSSHSFSDTPAWVTTPANVLASRLIVPNATGSALKASEAISRSETVSIMSRTLGILSDKSGVSSFFDLVSTDSHFSAVMSAVSYGLISGYPDSTFRPSGKLTRAEAMAIVARAMRFMNGKSVSSSSEITLEQARSIISKFTDSGTVDSWAASDIAECVQAGVVNGDNNGRLNPKKNVTRAELIQLMYNVLKSCGKVK